MGLFGQEIPRGHALSERELETRAANVDVKARSNSEVVGFDSYLGPRACRAAGIASKIHNERYLDLGI